VEKNARDAYSFNNVTSKKDKDGSITVHFGVRRESSEKGRPTVDTYPALLADPPLELIRLS